MLTLLIYLLIYLLTYLLTYLFTYLPAIMLTYYTYHTYLLTYLLTYRDAKKKKTNWLSSNLTSSVKRLID